jgi:peptide/nickel transport system substrate-binding protein
MADNYWSQILNSRIGRRRAIAATGATALGAAFLAACGGGSNSGDSGGGSSKDVSGLVVKPSDSTKDAKRGGIIKDRNTADPPTYDAHQAIAPLNFPARHVYSTLVVSKPGYLGPEKFELTGDIAESWEQSPDGLTVNMKLRQGVKFHNKAPINGRDLTAEDVVASWQRYAAKGALRGLVANSALSPQAPVLSLTSTDARTIQIKLKEPLVYALELFASYGSFTGNVVIMPKEVDNGWDPRGDMIGTGPYFLSNVTPSVSQSLKRFDGYWDKDAAFVDGIEYPVVLETAQVAAQLKAGNIHHWTNSGGGGSPPQEIMLDIKNDQPKLDLYVSDFTPSRNVLSFGLTPGSDGKAPFLDERVRQALSMSWDRDTFIDVFYNVSKFEKAGIPVESRWSTALYADWTNWWVDPKGKDFGPNGKYFSHDIAEGKKLMAAAGYPNGVTMTSHYVTGTQLDIRRFAEPLDSMTKDVGITAKVESIDYGTDYIPKYRDANGQYDGWAYHTVSGTTPARISPVSALTSEYWSKSAVTFRGFSASGKNDKAGDPQVDTLIEKMRLERDTEKRRGYVQELQRYLGKAMYGLIMPGGATGVSLAWPALRNYNTYRGASGGAAWTHYKEWLDTSKPPFTST